MVRLLVIFSCLVGASLVLVSGQEQDKSVECPPHEILENSANALCRHQQCIMIGKPVGCPSVSQCVPACVCQGDYLRAHNGTCVPEEHCDPQPCPNTYEIYSESISACAKETCESQSPDYVCDESAAPARAGCACAHELFVRRRGAPCDLYLHCPLMVNSSWCSPIQLDTHNVNFHYPNYQ